MPLGEVTATVGLDLLPCSDDAVLCLKKLHVAPDEQEEVSETFFNHEGGSSTLSVELGTSCSEVTNKQMDSDVCSDQTHKLCQNSNQSVSSFINSVYHLFPINRVTAEPD